MTDVVIGQEFAVCTVLIGADGCTEAGGDMPRPAVFIHAEIPVDPTVHAVVEIADDVMPVGGGILVFYFRYAGAVHAGQCGERAGLPGRMEGTALASHQFFIREEGARHGQGLKVVSGIPVEGDSFYHPGSLVVDHLPGEFNDPFFIMIPDVEAHGIGQTGFFEYRVAAMVSFCSVIIVTGMPSGGVFHCFGGDQGLNRTLNGSTVIAMASFNSGII